MAQFEYVTVGGKRYHRPRGSRKQWLDDNGNVVDLSTGKPKVVSQSRQSRQFSPTAQAPMAALSDSTQVYHKPNMTITTKTSYGNDGSSKRVETYSGTPGGFTGNQVTADGTVGTGLRGKRSKVTTTRTPVRVVNDQGTLREPNLQESFDALLGKNPVQTRDSYRVTVDRDGKVVEDYYEDPTKQPGYAEIGQAKPETDAEKQQRIQNRKAVERMSSTAAGLGGALDSDGNVTVINPVTHKPEKRKPWETTQYTGDNLQNQLNWDKFAINFHPGTISENALIWYGAVPAATGKVAAAGGKAFGYLKGGLQHFKLFNRGMQAASTANAALQGVSNMGYVRPTLNFINQAKNTVSPYFKALNDAYAGAVSLQDPKKFYTMAADKIVNWTNFFKKPTNFAEESNRLVEGFNNGNTLYDHMDNWGNKVYDAIDYLGQDPHTLQYWQY